MSRIIILSTEEQQKYERPPPFTNQQRRTFFALSDALQKVLNHLQTETNKVLFLVQFAYFKACQQFFDPNDFLDEDIAYAAKLLGIENISALDMSAYRLTKTPLNHQKRILDFLKYRAYDKHIRQWLIREVESLVARQVSPKKIFLTLLKLLQERCIVFPSYHALSKIISDAFLQQENKLTTLVRDNISEKIQQELEFLLAKNLETKQIPINSFKHISQSLKPKAIQASVGLFEQIKLLFHRVESVLSFLNLHEDSIRYYATWVKKAKRSQLLQMPDEQRYLHLVCFLQHQFYIWHDYSVDIFLKSVRSSMNSAKKKLSLAESNSRKDRRIAIQNVKRASDKKSELIDQIRKITISSDFEDDSQKIKAIEQLLDEYQTNISEQEKEDLKKHEDLLTSFADHKELYNHLEAVSIKLQNRVKDIFKTLTFNESTSDSVIYRAAKWFVEQNGQCNAKSPTEFLSKGEKDALLNDNNQFRAPLYKVLLFMHVSDAIRSGKLNLKYSYRYKAIQDYLISDEKWNSHKKAFLEKAELDEFIEVDTALSNYKDILSSLYDTVNRRSQGGLNPYLKINEQNQVIIKTPAQEEKETEYVADLLSQQKFVPILQVLTDIEVRPRSWKFESLH